jgi:hypothetical protein
MVIKGIEGEPANGQYQYLPQSHPFPADEIIGTHWYFFSTMANACS